MKLKKWLSAIFAVVMVMSLLPAAALAAEGENTDDSTTQVEEAADITKVQAPTAPKTDPQEPAAQAVSYTHLDYAPNRSFGDRCLQHPQQQRRGENG